jgi:hypothetical protein
MDKVKIGGWKTKASATALILIGLGGIIQGVLSAIDGNVDGGLAAAKGGVFSIAAGLSLVGIGHKIEKAKAAIETK